MDESTSTARSATSTSTLTAATARARPLGAAGAEKHGLAGGHGVVALGGRGHDAPARVALGPGLKLLAQPRRPGKRAHHEDGNERHVAPALQLPHGGRAGESVGAEHGAEPLPHVVQSRHREQQPPEEEQHDAPQVPQRRRAAGPEAAAGTASPGGSQDAPVQAPQKEVPRGAVPDAGEGPHHHGVQHPARGGHAVAAERYVHVVAEEAAQAHVPAAPELGGGARGVGVVEVARVLEAHHLAQAYGQCPE